MKKTLLTISILLLICVNLLAQESDNSNNENPRFLFSTFQPGVVNFELGEVTNAKLNYDMVSEEVLFITSGESFLGLAKPNEVRDVVIDGRTFEYAGKKAFYERVDIENGSIYVRWKSKAIRTLTTGAYGTTNESASISSVIDGNLNTLGSTVSSDFMYYPKNENNTRLFSFSSFLLKVDGKFKRISSAKSLAKLYKGHEREIEKYAKEENLGFKNFADIERLVIYANKIRAEK